MNAFAWISLDQLQWLKLGLVENLFSFLFFFCHIRAFVLFDLLPSIFLTVPFLFFVCSLFIGIFRSAISFSSHWRNWITVIVFQLCSNLSYSVYVFCPLRFRFSFFISLALLLDLVVTVTVISSAKTSYNHHPLPTATDLWNCIHLSNLYSEMQPVASSIEGHLDKAHT